MSCNKEVEMEEIKKLSSEINPWSVIAMKQSSSSAGSNSINSVSDDPSPNLSLKRDIDMDPDPKNFPPEVQI